MVKLKPRTKHLSILVDEHVYAELMDIKHQFEDEEMKFFSMRRVLKRVLEERRNEQGHSIRMDEDRPGGFSSHVSDQR